MGIAIKNNSHFTISKMKAINETTANNNERIVNVESQSVTWVYMYFIVIVVKSVSYLSIHVLYSTTSKYI